MPRSDSEPEGAWGECDEREPSDMVGGKPKPWRTSESVLGQVVLHMRRFRFDETE